MKLDGPIPAAEIPGIVAEKRAAVEKLGLTWKGTRFDRYQQIIDDTFRGASANLVVPTNTRIDPLLRREAMNQSIQLAVSRPCWERFRTETSLVARLRMILKGSLSQEADEDKARNTLLELCAGAVMLNTDLQVTFPDGDVEDLIVQLPTVPGESPLPPLAVECKRPQSVSTIQGNIKKLRREQIPARISAGYAHVLPVIGVDRFAPLPHTLSPFDTLNNAVVRSQRVAADEFDSLRTRNKFKLDPATAPAIGILVSGAIAIPRPARPRFWLGQMLTYYYIADAADRRVEAIKRISRSQLDADRLP